MCDTPAKVYGYKLIRWILLFCVSFHSWAASAQFRLEIKGIDKDSAFLAEKFRFKSSFGSLTQAMDYVAEIPASLSEQGFPAASVDSVYADSVKLVAHLYIGESFSWSDLNTDSVPAELLNAAGWKIKAQDSLRLQTVAFNRYREKMLEYLENNGYPFAIIRIDSLRFSGNQMHGMVRVDKGPLYHIDSIRNFGSARISPVFLQRYLGLMNGSLYKKDQLRDISTRLLELPYISEAKPWDMTLLGTGSILNLYLEPKKSSQVNVLLGLLPSNQQLINNKMLVTGEANINLRNALGNGETIGLNWQQIQPKSPRLDIIFRQPYLFKSPFGVNFNFDLFKKDSSFINITMLLGAQYSLSARQSGSVFFRNFSSNLLDVDTLAIKSSRRLPAQADLRTISIGVDYSINTTDYRFNPRTGNELSVVLSTGTKTIRKNNVIVRLQDPFDPGYNFNALYDTVKLKTFQFRFQLEGAHYFPLSRVSTIRTSLNAGWLQSEQIQRNELFQIGGYKLLRGFDEESIFASAYAVVSAEYRYFIGLNSYLFGFGDFGMVKNQPVNVSNSFFGAGLGLAFETKAGIFNMSYAAGKRNDTPFNLRQSKIHLGYINYF